MKQTGKKPDKGMFNGSCNRFACTPPDFHGYK